jgi:uncharacterized membrane protein YqhA
MSRFFSATRYLILIPIIGLGLAAAAFFLFGGINLIILLFETVAVGLGLMEAGAHAEEIPIIIEVVEYVHQFLIGTVLYITAIGFYQLFIEEIEFPGWLKIDSTEELETALVGVTVVVLAVNFLAQVFNGENINILAQGAGIAMPIAALGIFIGLRAWASRQDRVVAESKKSQSPRSETTED